LIEEKRTTPSADAAATPHSIWDLGLRIADLNKDEPPGTMRFYFL
jgi:hypothetical protein